VNLIYSAEGLTNNTPTVPEEKPSSSPSKQEHRETGAVALSVYLRYFKACSITLCIISIIFQVAISVDFYYYYFLKSYWLSEI
jgi:hypothetical protein